MPEDNRLRIAVGIATVGRPKTLARVVDFLKAQIRQPDLIVVCAPSLEDVGNLGPNEIVQVRISERGLCSQRNAILAAASHSDILVFYDDDFLPCPDYLSALECVFESYPEVVMATGRVLADGILGPGLSFDAARSIAIARSPKGSPQSAVRTIYNAYGCNMAVRMRVVQSVGLKFDETLPLYGWLEDVDFSRQLARHGRIVKVNTAAGVHMGEKSGRQTGQRLGYSQIANPLYLARKGTMHWTRAITLMSRNFSVNLVKSLFPSPIIDRRGRFLGHILALRDATAGKLDPRRILEL